MRSITFLVAVLAVTPVTSVSGQQQLPVKPGDRVRIVTATGVFGPTGAVTVVAVGADTLVVRREPNIWRVPIASVTRLEVSHGIDFSLVRDAAVGGSFFGGFGLVAGLVAAHECGPGIGLMCGARAGDVLLITAVLAGVGAAVGSVIGLVASIAGGESWERVGPPGLRNVSVAPQRDGRFGLGLSVKF